MTDRQFICACCGFTFTSGWSEEDCLKEKEEYFGDMPIENMSKTCDDCFKAIMIYNEHKNFRV